jgi:hypothetical protein
MNRTRFAALLLVSVSAAVLWWWWSATPDERAIRQRFETFAEEFNASTTDGLGTVARAARLGDYFTPDVVVELGEGTAPIHGRETLIGMAARLQPRTAAFVMEFQDVTIETLHEARADVALTLVIRRRSMVSGEESIDAREFSAEMRKDDGTWRVGRAVAIDTLR